MMSQPAYQTITIHILPNISLSQGKQTLKFGQLIECNKRNIFLHNSCKNAAGRLIPDLFLCLKKTLDDIKASGLQYNPQLGIQ